MSLPASSWVGTVGLLCASAGVAAASASSDTNVFIGSPLKFFGLSVFSLVSAVTPVERLLRCRYAHVERVMIAAIGRQAFHRDMAEHVQGAQLRAAAGRISNRKSTDRCDDGIVAGADAP